MSIILDKLNVICYNDHIGRTQVKKERDKWYECSQNLSDIVAKLKQENEELEKDQKRIIEACGYKKVVELQAQLSRVTEKGVSETLTPMLKAHGQSGDIELINDSLTWEILGDWYAKAIVREIKEGGDE